MIKFDENYNRAGYDSKLKQFFIWTYIWELIVDNIDQTSTFRDVKSGITGDDRPEKALDGFKTRYKLYTTNLLWSDKKYLPKSVNTIQQANEIVLTMDNEFKRIVEKELVWTKRQIFNNKDYGTEAYRVPKKYKNTTGIEYLKEIWETSFNESIFINCNQHIQKGKGFTFDGEFESILQELDYWTTSKNTKKVRMVFPTGFGKGLVLQIWGRHTKISKKSHINVYYANTIFNTRQLAQVHYDKYEYGGPMHGDNKKIVVCTDSTKIKTKDGKYIETFQASDSDGKLREIIKHALLNKDRYSFYVNKASAFRFNSIMNEIISDLNYKTPIIVGIDEIQDFTGYIDKIDITGAVTNPIKNSYQLGVTATEERTDDSNINRNDIVKNDNETYFGKLIYEILPSDAMALNRHSPIDFVTLVLDANNNDILGNALLKNNELRLKLGRKSKIVRARLLHTLSGIVKSIKDYNKKCVLGVASYRGDVDVLLECVELLQKRNIIPSDYLLVNGKIENRIESINTLNEDTTKKFICIGTSWLCVGMDAPKTDCVISTYDFGKKRFARQFVGRGVRYIKGKRCLVMIPVIKDDFNVPTLIYVKEDFDKDLNSHSNQSIGNIRHSNTSGVKKAKKITHSTIIATQCDPLETIFWNEYDNSVETNDLASFSFKKTARKYLLDGLKSYPTLYDVITKSPNTIRQIERHRNYYNINEIYNVFPDYSILPNTKIGLEKIVKSKKSEIAKDRNLFKIFAIKLNQIKENEII